LKRKSLRGAGLAAILIVAAAAGLPAARSQPASQLTDIASAVQQVRELYRTERFDELERTLDSMLASTRRFRSGATGASAAYWAFRLELRAPGVDAAEEGRVARWKAAVPKSRYAAFTEARYWYAAGWNTRGSGYAGSVAGEAWQVMEERLARAEDILLKNEPALGKTPLWHQLLLAIALDQRAPKRSADYIFNQAVQLFPSHYDFYELALTRMTPKWGGSWEVVERFISHWSEHLAASEGKSLYARLYVSLSMRDYPPRETRLDWNRMHASFRELVARYPDPAYRNNFASYACVYRDRAAFGEAIKLVGAQISPHDWIAGHPYEACMRWAST
jgi:tetratricopeptide (TPR) repeat protein